MAGEMAEFTGVVDFGLVITWTYNFDAVRLVDGQL